MDRAIIDYLPPVMQVYQEIRKICETEQIEIEQLWDCLDAAMKDQFVELSTVNGVTRWESILSLSPKASYTFDERKFRILIRINEQLPYTMTALKQQLETLCGKDGYTIKLDEYILTVKISLVSKSNLSDAGDLLRRMVPANLVIDLDLQYNDHEIVSKYTHGELTVYTHEEIRSEVI